MEHGNIRNLDQIQEREPGASGSRLGTLVMASLAGACVVFAVVALVKKPPVHNAVQADPLSELVSKSGPAGSARLKGPGLQDRDFAFPELLSDNPNPTTALATIPSANPGHQSAMVLPPGMAQSPPPATDKLPVVPLPAQNYLSLSPVVTSPRDGLTAAANHASTPTGPEASEGYSGGYQLQVSSFRLPEEATRFSQALRKRGHRAHYETANVPGKGMWYRVRIGPFKTKLEALRYRREFEQREHMVPFMVEPVHSATANKGRQPRIGD
jgi:hypothetical protein